MPERVRLTPKQSLIRYGNPYGDRANMFLVALNVAWKLRQLIHTHGGTTLPPIQDLDAELVRCIHYLEEHKALCPYTYSQFTGYAYVDLSASNWEGHMDSR